MIKQYLQSTKQLLLLIAPFFVSSHFASPTLAATFAFSKGEFELTNFSQSAVTVSDEIIEDTLSISKGGIVNVLAEAEASFMQPPLVGSNSSLSVAFGENRNYLGKAESEASLLGIFDVNAGSDFFFNFAGNLNLSTSIDNPDSESARASGDISFALIDIGDDSILDFFSLAGNLITEGDEDFIAYQKSSNVILTNSSTPSSLGGNQETATGLVEGSYKRNFTNRTNLALIEVKRNKVQVAAIPESSTTLALLLSSGVVGTIIKRRRFQ